MLKQLLGFVVLVAVASMVALSFLTARYIDKDEILRAQTEMRTLADERVQLQARVAALTAQQAELETKIQGLQTDVAAKEKHIAELEVARKEAQLSVRRLQRPAEIEAKFKETFPEVAGSKWGVSRIRDEENNVEIPYLMVPLVFSETFVIDHQNALSFRAQRDVYQQVAALQHEVIGLKDNVLALEKEKSAAFQQGYDKAFALYTDLNAKYVELLQKPPKVEFKPPNLLSSLGGALLGIAIGAKL